MLGFVAKRRCSSKSESSTTTGTGIEQLYASARTSAVLGDISRASLVPESNTKCAGLWICLQQGSSFQAKNKVQLKREPESVVCSCHEGGVGQRGLGGRGQRSTHFCTWERHLGLPSRKRAKS